MKKMHKNILAKYNQWISDGNRKESVEMLREFIDRESQFLITASETITGITKEPTRKDRHGTSGRTLLTQNSNNSTVVTTLAASNHKCPVCSQQHGLWACDNFKKSPIGKRWDIAKENKACFRCLSILHQGKNCPRSKTCGIQGCKQNHHLLLHGV